MSKMDGDWDWYLPTPRFLNPFKSFFFAHPYILMYSDCLLDTHFKKKKF